MDTTSPHLMSIAHAVGRLASSFWAWLVCPATPAAAGWESDEERDEWEAWDDWLW